MIILEEQHILTSTHLAKDLTVDFYLPTHVEDPSALSLLLINDGQNMEELGLQKIVTDLYTEGTVGPLLCVAIHTGPDRRMDYGVAGEPDYLLRGAKAGEYTAFIMTELLPFIYTTYNIGQFQKKGFAGFSLGALSALDITWNHPQDFSVAGVFSGSLWWRNIDQDDESYNDDQHRIMHQVIRRGAHRPGMKFLFQCGNMDETCDRNNNGIIDSIDDTLDLIKELHTKGYDPEKDISYLELEDGHHDIATWARAMPVFLRWAFAR